MDRDVIYIVSMNTRDIYSKVKSLRNAVRNRMIKGLPVSKDHLINCSSMKSIIRSARICEESYGGKVTKSEMELGANLIAEAIIEEASIL